MPVLSRYTGEAPVRRRGDKLSRFLSFSWAVHASVLISTLATTTAFPLRSSGPIRRSAAGVVERRVAASASSFTDFGGGASSPSNNGKNNLTGTAVELWSELLLSDQDEVQDSVDRKKRALARRSVAEVGATSSSEAFRVSLSLASKLGIVICEVGPQRSFSHDRQMDLDTLRAVSVPVFASKMLEENQEGEETFLTRDELVACVETLDSTFRGLIVTSVEPSSEAWKQGVRPGHVLLAVSATLGDAVWPKSTLEGVRSAIASRRLTSSSVDLRFQRPRARSIGNMYVGVDAVQAKAVDNQYELTLTRPIGLLLQETEGGRVQVAGFSEIAPRLVQYAIKVGDYVVAVDSSVGDRMWPVSTVEGVISACTSRLPGQSITMRFERPESDLTSVAALRDTARAGVVARKETVLDGVLSTPSVSATAADRIAMDSSNKQLLSRCRDVLKRYVKEDENNLLFVQSKFRGKYALPALVADKVVDSLASAKAVVDCTTLSMIMDAYLSCRRPDRALWVFEAATGFGADASVSLWETSRRAGRVEKAFQPNDGALDLITGTMLLKAHAMRGDAHSVARVLAALEGRSGTVIGGLEVAPWPWTGTYGSIKLDTKCYNIAMAAFESIGGEFALKQAMQVFDRLAESSSPTSGSPGKDVVSYNTMISILANEGRSEEALALFERMKRSGTALRPDKFTYTSLIKAVSNQDDIQELLYDMRERGVEPDCVTYNTMIKSLCESKRWTQATRLVTEMESRGIVPDSMTYGYLMSSMLKTGKANACLALFESACASPRTSALTENVYLYTTAITAASMLGDYERALELVARMNAVGIRPNMVTLTAVMGACLSSGRADLASQIFHRMEGPDGYAMAQGVQAMCASGEADSALELLQKQQRGALAVMSGKDIMRSYHAVIKSSLDRCDFDTARAAAADLFSKGYIPSRSIVMAVTEMLRVTSGDDAGSKDDDRQRFLFVLYLVDSTIGRKLPVDSRLYTGLLAFAARKGGMIRKVASLMAGAKTSVGSTTSKLLLSVTGDDEDEGIPSSGSAPAIIPSWEALCIGYESYMEVLKENASSLAMPALPVRATSRDFPRVLRAEQLVTSSRGTASSLSSKLPRRRSLAGSRQ